jgi:hypothetical protein
MDVGECAYLASAPLQLARRLLLRQRWELRAPAAPRVTTALTMAAPPAVGGPVGSIAATFLIAAPIVTCEWIPACRGRSRRCASRVSRPRAVLKAVNGGRIRPAGDRCSSCWPTRSPRLIFARVALRSSRPGFVANRTARARRRCMANCAAPLLLRAVRPSWRTRSAVSRLRSTFRLSLQLGGAVERHADPGGNALGNDSHCVVTAKPGSAFDSERRYRRGAVSRSDGRYDIHVQAPSFGSSYSRWAG